VQTSHKTDETAISRAFIDRALDFLLGDYLPKIERCLEKLTDEQIWWRANEESNSIGNLILHLCGNARQWIMSGVGSQPDARVRDSEFEQRDPIARDALLQLLRSTLAEIETVLRALDPAILLERRKIQGHDVDLLEAIFHVTEHFSMHTGQIIMLTKMTDRVPIFASTILKPVRQLSAGALAPPVRLKCPEVVIWFQ
jgi:uncharacterized damage-inducible protein DinB